MHKLRRVELNQGDVVESDNIEGLHLWEDLIPESYAFPLVSTKFRRVIEKHLTGNESIDWIHAPVEGNDVIKDYFILKFRHKLDVLDTDKTVFGENTEHIIIPHFSSHKVAKYTVFHKPGWFWQVPTALYITDDMKKEISKEKITGIKFEEVRIT